jgi:hypothetical protein
MAQNLLINILAKDKTKQALGSVQAGLGRLQNTVFSIQGALAGIGGALVIKSLLSVGSQVENLGVRFAFLFKGMEEGNKAFNELINFAAKVPFSLGEISAASGNLAVVSKDAEELAKILEVTGNVATVTGLDFAITATQIQRAFSGGIAAADVFRERGVRDLLGFEAGAKKTAKETRDAFFKVFGPDGEFGNAMKVMAVTFTGTLSMLGDKLFKFKLETNRAGFFDFIKNGLVVINEMIEQNGEMLAKASARTSDFLIGITKQILISGAIIVDALRPVFKFVAKSIGGLMEVLKSLPPGAQEFGVIGFLMLGGKGKGLVLIIGGFIDEIRSKLGTLLEEFALFNQKILDTRKSLFLVSKEGYEKILQQNKDLLEISEKLKKPLAEINNETQKVGQYSEEWMMSTRAVNDFLKKVEENMALTNEQMKKLLELAGKVNKEVEETGVDFNKVGDIIKEKIKKQLESVNERIAKGIIGSVKSLSKGLAEVVVRGKELNMTLKEIAQSIMVNILSSLIEEIALRQINKILGGEEVKTEATKLNLLKSQNTERKRAILFNALGGGGGFSLPGFAKGGAVSKGKAIVVGERGPEMFVPNSTGQITQSSRGTSGNGTTVNFNINTVDASGFEELLVRSRGTITQLINSAVNERGKESLI